MTPPDEDRRPPPRALALAVLIAGVALLAAAPALEGYLTMAAAAVGLVLVVVGASLGPRRPR